MLLPWICAAVLGSVSPAPAPAPPLDANAIVQKVAARDRVLQKRRREFDYDLDITREKLDDQNRATSTTHEKMVVKGDKRPDFGTRPASGAPEDEAKKASREEPFELLHIIGHYDFKLEGIETVEGIPCYKIAFTPKPGMPYANREEKVLNAVSGHLWASTATYSLIRNEGALMHPVSVAWVFASLEKMDFHFETMRMPDGEYAPRQEKYSYLVSIPFFTLHERDTRQMSNYRPAGTGAPRP